MKKARIAEIQMELLRISDELDKMAADAGDKKEHDDLQCAAKLLWDNVWTKLNDYAL